MNKMLKKIFLLLFFIVFIPFFVCAKEYEIESTSISKVIKDFQFGEISLVNFGATKYYNYNSTGKPGLAFSGNFFNNYSFDIDFKLNLKLYDKNDNLIKTYTENITINSKESLFYRIPISEVKEEYLIDDVYSFIVEIDVLTNVEMSSEAKSSNYYLENYNVRVNVNQNNVFNVEETFLTNFKKNIVPVKMEIPLIHEYTREDGSKAKKRVVLSNIEINDFYELSINEGKKVLDIGKVDKLNNKKTYSLKYDYNIGKDKLKSKDEFVFYLVNNYGCKIENLTFEIIFPSNIDESTVKFIDNNGIVLDDIDFKVEGNVLKGKIDGLIGSDTSIAVNVILNDNYFKNCSLNISFYTIISFIIPIVYIVLCFIMIFIGVLLVKKEVYKGNLCFNKNINSLELGFLYSGKVDDKDIASLIIFLANKGYIKINKLKKDYRIVKVKDYLENNKFEKIFMEELFKEKNTLSRNDLVISLKNLKEKITFKSDYNFRKKKILNGSIFSYKLIFFLMILSIIVIMPINLLIDYQPNVILINIIVCGLGYLIITYSAFKNVKPLEKFLYILVGMILVTTPIVLTSYKAFNQGFLYIAAYIFGVICMLLIGGISENMSNRTLYGIKMYNKVSVYKKYLLDLDDEKIDKELSKDEEAFYNLLSYSFALGISDNIADKIKDKKLVSPSWYNTNNFNFTDFYADLQNIYYDVYLGLKNSGSIE